MLKILITLFVFIPASLFAEIIFEQPVVVVPCEAGQAIVYAELPFKVQGDKVVSIASIKTSCSCTTGEADAPQYAPGAVGKIKLTFTVGERVGFQRKTITVKTSDGQEQVAFFQTTVPQILEIKPSFVFWKKDEPPTSNEIQLTVLVDRPVEVQKATAIPNDAFDVELQPVHAGKQYRLKITPKDTTKPSTARIVLKTDFPSDSAERFVIVAAVK